MSLKDMTPHTGKHAKAKAVRPVGLVSKAKSTDLEFAEELERVKALIVELAAGLDASGDKLDVSLRHIDLERELGIER